MVDQKIIGFVCRSCTDVKRIKLPKNIKIVEVLCSSRIDTTSILRALRDGADGVFVAMCEDDECWSVDGNYKTRRRVELLKRVLSALRIEHERVCYLTDTQEKLMLKDKIMRFESLLIGMGPSPLRGEDYHEDDKAHH